MPGSDTRDGRSAGMAGTAATGTAKLRSLVGLYCLGYPQSGVGANRSAASQFWGKTVKP